MEVEIEVEVTGEERGVEAARGGERGCTGVCARRGGGGEKEEFFALRPFCFLILLAFKIASLAPGSFSSSGCSRSGAGAVVPSLTSFGDVSAR